jgi:ABC-type branched-subunit amino acid transport system ATPase component/ABC-type branched-subunit amino acid transport system permease subunit
MTGALRRTGLCAAGALLLVLAMQAVFGRSSTGRLLGVLPFWDGIPTGVLLNGAVLGTLYALVAFGVILVYKASRILNFATAALGAVPGVLALLLVYDGVPYLLALGIAVVGAVVTGVVVETLILRPFRTQARLVVTVATIGLAQLLVLVEAFLPRWIVGENIAPTSFPTPFAAARVEIGGVILTGDYLAILVLAGLLMVGLAAFFRFTDTGIAVRASAENSDRALLLGIPVTRIGTLVWVLATVCSALAVFLRGPVVGVSIGTNLSPVLLLYGLAAAVIARMSSLPVALAAGMAIGVLEQGSFFATSKPDLSVALVLPVLLVALLRQRRSLSRATDAGVTSFRALREYRAIPVELRHLPKVRAFRIGSRVLVAVLALGAPYLVGDSQTGFVTLIVVYAIVAVSLVVLSGWAGQISLGQFAFAGVGAGVAGGLVAHSDADFFVAMTAAVISGAVVALVIGVPALRVPGLFLAAVTLAFAATVQNLFLKPEYVGRLVPDPDDVIGRPVLWGRVDTADDRVFYYVCLVGLVLCYLSARSLRSSRSGRVFVGVRDNVRAAQGFGVRNQASTLAAFAVSGAMAAMAGALLAYQQGAVDSTAFPLQLSLDAFVITVIGGLSSLPGAIAGAVLYQGLRYFNPFDGFFTVAISSGVLTLLTVAPGGLAEVGHRVRDRFLRRVAADAGIVVPSLLADRNVDDDGVRVDRERPAFEPTDDALLVCRGVDAGYDGVQVLFGVDLEIRRGEVLALLGTNGAGKSTLLRCVSGLLSPTAGTVHLDGVDITGSSAIAIAKRGVVQVPGGRGVFPTLTVTEHFRAAAWLHGKEPERVAAAVEEVLTRFPRLRERLDTLGGDLSGGEQQQLALGMALIADPVLLVIDELSLGLAPKVVAELLELVREINARGTAVVLVEQSVNVALTVASRAYFMEKGEVRFEGPTAELLERGDIVRSVFLEGAGTAASDAVRGRPSTTAVPRPAPEEPAAPPAVEPVLEAVELAVSFGGVKAVDGVSLRLAPREILGLIGPNGAGKTTVFDLLSGFLVADRGRVSLAGRDVTAWTPDRRARAGLGRSFQDARIFGSLTVAENLALSLERHLPVRDHLAAALGLPDVREAEVDIAWTVADLVELMGLGAFRDKFASELSTGSRRVVDLAMSIAHDPTVLVLDEPSSGIAQREAEALGPLLHRIRQETGCAMLVVEHDMPLVTGVSDRLLALELGRVIADGPPRDVVADPRVVASYLGDDTAAVSRSGVLAGAGTGS